MGILGEHDPGACYLIFVAAGSAYVFDVDLFDSATGRWSTAQLSASNYLVCSASVGMFALFVGFSKSGMSFLLQIRTRGVLHELH